MLLKRKLKNGGQQLHQYHPSFQHIKRPLHMPLEISVLAWDRRKNVASLNRIMISSKLFSKCNVYGKMGLNKNVKILLMSNKY